ncbi:MAG: InlB B-repeat-containing protein [Bacteroidales bacterium]|nr:InlB B-repeat-containing protein [Bacteroidales bacterium]
MKRINIFLLSELFFALTFFSCNKHDDDKTEPEKTTVENNSGNDNTEVTPEKVTVTFDILGGNGTAEPQTVEKGTKITLPSGDGMKKDGYKFLGWSLTENGEIITEYTATESEVKLYAVWVKVFTVKFDTDGGTGAFASQTIEKGKTATKPETKPEKKDNTETNPEKKDYIFLGWYNGEAEYDFNTTVDADITLKAAWLEIISVDLGLQSGLLWTTCNIGASKPEEYGDYYAWGETEAKENYYWNTYRYGSAENALTKYCSKENYGNKDNLTELEAGDDVATVKLGSDYRMPTKEDWEELFNDSYTYNVWTDNYNGTNVVGRIVYKKKDGGSYALEDTHIFLPAAGSRNGSGVDGVGYYGYYWSSSLDTDNPNFAFFCYFNSGGSDWNSKFRCDGLSVRAVRVLQN